MLSPLTVADPWAGVVAIAMLLAIPVTDGDIVLLLLFAATVVLVDATVGGGGVTVILMLAADDVPPGPVAVTKKLSFPLYPALGV